MHKNVVSLRNDASYEDAGRLLYEHNISGVPVIDECDSLIGMISEKDLFRILYPLPGSFHEHPERYLNLEDRERKLTEIKRNNVEHIMTQKVIVVRPDTPIMRAGALMLARGVSRLPVIEQGRMVGIITRTDIFRTVLKNHLGL